MSTQSHAAYCMLCRGVSCDILWLGVAGTPLIRKLSIYSGQSCGRDVRRRPQYCGRFLLLALPRDESRHSVFVTGPLSLAGGLVGFKLPRTRSLLRNTESTSRWEPAA